MSSEKITLYDICTTLQSRIISPWVTRTRLVLNVKKVPFETVWIRFPEVEATAKKLGAAPTATLIDGRPRYTVPIVTIESPGNESLVLSDSLKIAQYFDERIPEPPLFSKDTLALNSLAERYIAVAVIAKLDPIFLIHGGAALDEASVAHFVPTRVLINGIPFEDSVPKNTEEIVQAKKAVYAALDALAKQLDKVEQGNFRVTPGVSYAETGLAAYLHAFKAIAEHSKAGAEHADDWKTIAAANGGRWAKLLELPEYRETRSSYLK